MLAAVAIILQSPIRYRQRRRPRYDPVKIRRHHLPWLGAAALVAVVILIAGQVIIGFLERNRDHDALLAQPPARTRQVQTHPAEDLSAVAASTKFSMADEARDPMNVATKLWQPGESAAATPAPAAGAQLPPFRFRGDIRLPREEYPIIGRIDAPALALWILDYRDPSSRLMFRQMEEVRRHFGSQLALIVIPIDAPPEAMQSLDFVPSAQNADPRDDLTALALTVFKVKPASFELFHRFLLGGEKAPTLDAARQFAGSLITPERLRLMRDHIDLQDQMRRHLRIYKTGESPTVPQLHIAGEGVAVRPQHPEALAEIINLLETKLKLRPVDVSAQASTGRASDSLP